jgi:iron complex outermembrane receptor protein
MPSPPRRATAVALIAALQVPVLARAEPSAASGLTDLELEELLALPVETVSTASKREERASSAPASVTVVTAQEIAAYGYRTLAEALDGVRGLYTSCDRNYTYLGVRGFSPADWNARVLLLLDGHQLNDDVYDAALIAAELPLDLALVERIEVVRGPGSALYGGNALFAVVNVITKRATRAAGAAVEAGAGSAETWNARATYGFVRERAEGLVSASASAAGGRDLFYPEYAGQGARGDGIARDDDWERFANAFAKVSLGRFTFQAAGAARAKGVPTGAWGTVYDDPRRETFDARGFAELRWERPADEEGPGLALRAYWDEYAYHERYPYESGDPAAPTYVNRDELVGRWAGGEARVTWRFGERLVAIAGAELELHLRQDLWNRDEGEGGAVWTDERHGSTVAAAYANVEAEPFPWLELVAGARYDHYSTFGGALSPRAAVLVRPASATVLKLLYGRAFRPPNAAELYYQHPAFWTQTPPGALRPEDLHTGELVLEQGLGGAGRATLVAYRYLLRDLVVEQVDPATGIGRNVNGESVAGHGVEGELEWRWRGGAASLSYALQRATGGASGGALPNSPTHVAKLHLRAPLGWRLRGGLEVLHLSERSSAAAVEVPGHLRVNLSIAARGLAGGALDVSATLRNALDASYADPARPEHLQSSLPRDGRALHVGASYRF